MTEITTDTYQAAVDQYVESQGGPENVSEADLQAFLDFLGASEEFATATLDAQFEKGFQTMSYLFMKGVFSHVEDQVRNQR